METDDPLYYHTLGVPKSLERQFRLGSYHNFLETELSTCAPACMVNDMNLAGFLVYSTLNKKLSNSNNQVREKKFTLSLNS